MYKGFLVLLLSVFLFSCAWHVIDDPGQKSKNETIVSEGTTSEYDGMSNTSS